MSLRHSSDLKFYYFLSLLPWKPRKCSQFIAQALQYPLQNFPVLVVVVFVWTLDSRSRLKDPSSHKIVMEHESGLDPGSWTLGPIWIVIVHAGRHQPAWHSRHLLSTLAAPGQSWAPEFYGPPPDFNDDSAPTLRGIGSSLSLIIWT